jgi:hypothetical protein
LHILVLKAKGLTATGLLVPIFRKDKALFMDESIVLFSPEWAVVEIFQY